MGYRIGADGEYARFLSTTPYFSEESVCTYRAGAFFDPCRGTFCLQAHLLVSFIRNPAFEYFAVVS